MKYTYFVILSFAIAVNLQAQISNGSYAPSFTLYDKDGGSFQLSDLKGKVILINFFATWCGPCKRELPQLESVWRENHHKNFAMLVIGVGETHNSISRFNFWRGMDLPFFPDEESSIFSAYYGKSIPYTILVDENGIVKYTCVGYEESEFDLMLQKLHQLLE